MPGEPQHVVVAGDWHGNGLWARKTILMLPELLPKESERILIHVGDFGIWPGPGGEQFLNTVNNALTKVNAHLVFVHGNHDDIPQLINLAGDPHIEVPVRVRDRVTWLPHGCRWSWHGRTWLALGGAASADRSLRQRRHWPWWPEEEITVEQAMRVSNGGRADVMVCHDAPTCVPLDIPPPAPDWTREDLDRCAAHRTVLQGVVDNVTPSFLLHGHYHWPHDTTVTMKHGPMRVVGLDREGHVDTNLRVLDVQTMQLHP